MGIASLFRKLVGAGASAGPAREGKPVDYQGYTIRPAPQAKNGQFLTAGTISKTFAEGDKQQTFIRADTHASFTSACDHAIAKGRQIIDEQGDRLFQQQ